MSRTLTAELYRTDINGKVLEDLTTAVQSGSVNYSASRSGSTALQGSFTLNRADALEPLVDFVSPFLTITEEDGTSQRRRIGIFQASIPDESHSLMLASPTYNLSDLTDLLRRAGQMHTYSIPSGTNFSDAISGLIHAGLDAWGLKSSQIKLPHSTGTTGRNRTNPRGTPYLSQINDLCDAFGWYHLWMQLDGSLHTRATQLLSATTPIKTLDTSAPAATGDTDPIVKVQPVDPDSIANIVVVAHDNGDTNPIYAVRRNDDADSPTSTVNIGPRIYGDGPYSTDAESAATVGAVADHLMEVATSYERQLTMSVEPDLDLLGMWQTLDLEIDTVAGANLRGRYWIKGWTVGFGTEHPLMDLTLSRVVRFDYGEDR